jgi:hypothetical protein
MKKLKFICPDCKNYCYDTKQGGHFIEVKCRKCKHKFYLKRTDNNDKITAL